MTDRHNNQQLGFVQRVNSPKPNLSAGELTHGLDRGFPYYRAFRYSVTGPRVTGGWCGHAHRTPRAAGLCLAKMLRDA